MSIFRYKMLVADVVVSYVKPIQEKIEEYMQDQEYLFEVLRKGALASREIAEKTITEVRGKLGIDFEIQKEHRKSFVR